MRSEEGDVRFRVIWDGGTKSAPQDAEGLERLAAEGHIKANTIIINADTEEGMPASSYSFLRQAIDRSNSGDAVSSKTQNSLETNDREKWGWLWFFVALIIGMSIFAQCNQIPAGVSNAESSVSASQDSPAAEEPVAEPESFRTTRELIISKGFQVDAFRSSDPYLMRITVPSELLNMSEREAKEIAISAKHQMKVAGYTCQVYVYTPAGQKITGTGAFD